MRNWEKLHFMVEEDIVLLHRVSQKGIEKLEVIEKLLPPICVEGFQSLLEHAGSYRRIIKDFSKISAPHV